MSHGNCIMLKLIKKIGLAHAFSLGLLLFSPHLLNKNNIYIYTSNFSNIKTLTNKCSLAVNHFLYDY